MDVIKLIEKYYEPGSKAHYFLVNHSKLVALKALQVAERVRELGPDFAFIEEASMLHDIGIFMTNDPKLGCYGPHPYICHGFFGKEILEKEGLFKHALVCERHIGVGLTAEDVRKYNLPLPHKDMLPVSLEEKIICFADKFYSKGEENLTDEKPVEIIRKLILNFNESKLGLFDEWLIFFKEKY